MPILLRLRVAVPVVIAALLSASCSRQAKLDRRVAAGDEAYATGNFDRAEIEYLNALALDPGEGRALAGLGKIAFDDGHVGNTYSYLSRARDLRPNDLDLRTKLGLYFLAGGRWEAARNEARFVLQHRPADAQAVLLLANSSVTPADVASAREILGGFSGTGESAALATARGILDVRTHQLPEARTEFARALTLDAGYAPAITATATLAMVDGDLATAARDFAAAAEHSPDRSPQRLQLAQFDFEHGHPDQARQILQAMITKTPDYLPALMLLAEISAREHKYPESSELVTRVLGKDPIHLEALLLQARIAIETGQAASTAPALEKVLRIYPQSAPLRYYLALCDLGAGETAKAANILAEALALAPDFADAVLLNASMTIRRGEPKSAVVALKQFVQRHPNPPVRAWILLAEAFHASGDLNEALAVYRQAAEQAPTDPELSWLAGLIQLQQGQRVVARASFEHALALSPEYLPAVEQLVGLDLDDKNLVTALARVDAHLAKSPHVAGLHLLRAKVLTAQGNDAEAEKSLHRALELDPSSPNAFYALARLYVAGHRQDKALASLKESNAKNPRDVPTLMLMGAIEQEQGNFAGAREAYEKIVALNSRYAPALNNLAYLYSEQLKQPDQALRMAQRAREVLPNDAHVADTLGWILYQGNQFSWAVALLEESAAKLPDSPAIQYHLGMARLALGDESRARDALTRALRANADFAGKSEAQETLALLAIDPAKSGATDQSTIEHALSHHPDDPLALGRRAAIEEHEGTLDRARTDYEKILRGAPKNLTALIGLARVDENQGQNARAFDLAKDAHELKPEDASITHRLGRLALATGNSEWSLTLLQDAAQSIPDSGELQYDLARAQFSVGNVREASDTMSRALRLSSLMPHAADARQFVSLLSLVSQTSDRPDGEDKDVTAALQVDPGNPVALYVRAAQSRQHGDAAAAIRDDEAILNRLPSFLPAMRDLAILYPDSQSKKAAEYAVKARARFPTDPELAKAFGLALFRQGDMTGAEKVLEEASERSPADAETWLRLGQARLKLGQVADGRRALQKAVDLNPRTEIRQQAESALAGAK
ncbi:MAG TPA: tetratricopeptide repeat protein [Candidatus Didemnitutus sp.]|nr:tetratricopeptide repeat protein [Candidatus Didemnitutus sp.]